MRRAGIDVVAVCDVNPEALTAAPLPANRGSWSWSANCGEANLEGVGLCVDYQEMFANERPDIVGVATTKQHTEIVKAAALGGAKAIFCEKPMAPSLTAAREMVEACQRSGTLLAVNHTRRWWPEHQRMREMVREGIIGEICDVEVRCGGARLVELGIHFVDWMRWIVGSEVSSVKGWLDPITEPNPREGLGDYPGRIELTFANGVSGRLLLRRDVALPPWFLVEGIRGRVFIQECKGDFDRWEVWARPEKGKLVGTLDYYCELVPRRFESSGKIDWVEMTAAAYRELVGGKTSCSGEDGYAALKVLIAASVSHGVPFPDRSHFPDLESLIAY